MGPQKRSNIQRSWIHELKRLHDRAFENSEEEDEAGGGARPLQ